MGGGGAAGVTVVTVWCGEGVGENTIRHDVTTQTRCLADGDADASRGLLSAKSDEDEEEGETGWGAAGCSAGEQEGGEGKGWR